MSHRASGRSWRNIGGTRPAVGRELDSHDLARRLDTQLEFTHAEWAAFVITYPVWDDGDSTESEGLHIDDYIKSADGIYVFLHVRSSCVMHWDTE
jgi:hypothetical protein